MLQTTCHVTQLPSLQRQEWAHSMGAVPHTGSCKSLGAWVDTLPTDGELMDFARQFVSKAARQLPLNWQWNITSVKP